MVDFIFVGGDFMGNTNDLVQHDENVNGQKNKDNEVDTNEEEKSGNLIKLLMEKGNRHGLIWFFSFLFINILSFVFVYDKIIGILARHDIIGPIIVLVAYFFILLVFNIALSFCTMDILSKIHEKFPKGDKNKTKHHKSDSLKTYDLLVYLLWTPSLLIWFALYLVLVHDNYLRGLVFVGIFFPFKVGIHYIYEWSSLLHRTLRPDGEIQTDYDGLFK